MSEHDWKPNPFADGWERCVGCGLVLSPGSPVEARAGDCAAAQIATLTEDRRRLLERLRACTCGESAAAPRAVEPDYDTRRPRAGLTTAQASGEACVICGKETPVVVPAGWVTDNAVCEEAPRCPCSRRPGSATTCPARILHKGARRAACYCLCHSAGDA